MKSMEIEFFDTPYKYLIVDNFLPEDDFKKIQNYPEEIFEDDYTLGRFQHRKYTVGKSNNSDLDHVNACKESAIHIWDNYYEKLMNNDIDQRDQFTNLAVDFQRMGPPPLKSCLRGSVHPDSEIKLMSIVLYISEHGTGTYLHDPTGYYMDGEIIKETKQGTDTFVKEIEWKQNRAFIFVRNRYDNDFPLTVHSIRNNTEYLRDTAVIFIQKPKVKNVT